LSTSATGKNRTPFTATFWVRTWWREARAGPIASGRFNSTCTGRDSIPIRSSFHPVQPGNSDLCFAWDGPIEEAVAHLNRLQVAIEEGPVRRNGAAGAGASVYFRDPDGSLLEFISYHHADA
jgi:catechol 2,3-dioxygenase-like lactoylglutathione lyase family enzyme